MPAEDCEIIRKLAQGSTLAMQDIAGAMLHAAAEYVQKNGGKMELPFVLHCCGDKKTAGVDRRAV